MPGLSAPRVERRLILDWLVGGIVVLLCLIGQLVFLLGPYPYDPALYFSTGVEFPSVAPNIWTLRIGVVLPVTAAVWVFGPSEAALYMVPILTGLVLAAAVYGTMLLLFRDRLLAAAASFVTVLNVNWLLKSSSIFPDTTATASFAAGFLFLVAAGRASDERARGWWPTVFAVCAGVFFGWTYLAREFSLVLIPVVLAGFVLLRYPLRRAAIVVGAAVATMAIELLYGLLQYDTPFMHARILRLERHRPPKTSEAVLEHIQSQLDSPLETIVAFPRLLLAWQTGWVMLSLIVLFLAGLAFRYRDRRLWLLAGWCFSFWLAMAILGLGTLPSGRWIVNIAIIRYWYPIFPPLVMGAFAAVALLVPGRWRIFGRVSAVHAVAGALTAFILVPGFVEFRRCEAKNVWLNDSFERWHELRAWFATAEADRFDEVWGDTRGVQMLPAYTHSTFGGELWDGSLRTLRRERREVAPPPGGPRRLILVYRAISRQMTRSEEARRSWSPVFVSSDQTMMLLAHESAPFVAGSADSRWWETLRSLPRPPEPGICGRPWVRTSPGS